MSSCLFCRLVAEELPGHGLYEDAQFVVILDKASLGFGHCMIIPKQHVVEVHELSHQVYVALFLLAKAIATRLKAATGVRAIGYTAFGSGLPHAHLHLVPHDDPQVLADSLKYVHYPSEGELQEQAQQLRPFLIDLSASGSGDLENPLPEEGHYSE